LRRRIFKCPVEEADIWWWGVATNYNVSSRQGSRLLGLSPFTIPCLSLPDPCLSFTINFSEGVWYGDPTCTPHRPWNLSLDSLSLSISGGMCRFEFRIEEADF